MRLYHYVHCPFCVRVRMGMGLLGKSFESHVLPYDDEQTPKTLTGKKMLPIMVNDQGVAMNESLDILKAADTQNKLKWELLETHGEELNKFLDAIGSEVHSLCMPYWVWTPEFNESSRNYFQTKKEVKRGPFKNLIKNKDHFIKALDKVIAEKIEPQLAPYFKSDELTILDIMLAAHLWGMYIFPEYQFSPSMHQYLQQVKSECRFDYHKDFWL
jgi:glutaredoxin 2